MAQNKQAPLAKSLFGICYK